jgi:hypothetical protein
MNQLLEIDQISDEELISAITDMAESDMSFAEIMQSLKLRYGNTYDSRRAASIVRDYT